MIDNYEFTRDIIAMNKMYELPVNQAPTLKIGEPLIQRLRNFKSVLTKELKEMDDIIQMAGLMTTAHPDAPTELEVLTALADLFGDIQVYAVSEAVKFGIPNTAVLKVIMQSNYSKLGANGEVLKDDEGKFLKGPNYWKPEPKIELLLGSLQIAELAEQTRQATRDEATVLGAFDPLPTGTTGRS